MANLIDWIEKLAASEKIRGVVIGHSFERDGNEARPYNDRLLSWKEARPILDYDFFSGFGTADCHPVYAWTMNWIITVNEYDGSTSPVRIPRNPTAFVARFASDEPDEAG
jgi:hypothetical protein